MRYDIKMVMVLSFISVSTINTQAMDQQNPSMNNPNSFDVSSDSFKGTLLERLPKDINGPIRMHMVPLTTFKCPSVGELKARGGEVDYKDDNGIAFVLGDEFPREIISFITQGKQTFFTYLEEFLNVVISDGKILCNYSSPMSRRGGPAIGLTLDFEASGFTFDQISYDHHLFHKTKNKKIVSPDGVNIEFTVRLPK